MTRRSAPPLSFRAYAPCCSSGGRWLHQPIVDLRVFTNRDFALGSFFTFLVGTGMYSAAYLIPLFLAQVRGFSALQIGETVFVAG